MSQGLTRRDLVREGIKRVREQQAFRVNEGAHPEYDVDQRQSIVHAVVRDLKEQRLLPSDEVYYARAGRCQPSQNIGGMAAVLIWPTCLC